MVVSAAILKSSIYDATAVSRGRPTTRTYSSSSLALGEGKQTNKQKRSA